MVSEDLENDVRKIRLDLKYCGKFLKIKMYPEESYNIGLYEIGIQSGYYCNSLLL